MKIAITLEPNGVALWLISEGEVSLLKFLRNGTERSAIAWMREELKATLTTGE